MATSVILPKQGQSVESCIITEWYKKKGEKVEKGDLLFAYETDKSSFEEEAREEGVLLEVFYAEGDEVPVLTEVALIGKAGEKVSRVAGAEAAGASEGAPKGTAPEAGDQEKSSPDGRTPAEEEPELSLPTDGKPEERGAVPGKSPDTREVSAQEKVPGSKIRISPRARKVAEVRGIDPSQLTGSGPQGRIIVRDIEAAVSAAAGAAQAEEPAGKILPEMEAATAEAALPDSAAGEPAAGMPVKGDWLDRPLSHMRRLISRAMHASLQNSAQLTHHLSADARSILSLRKKMKQMQEDGDSRNITLNDMICFATIRALKKHPDANVHYLGESIRYFNKIHLGIAVDTERGLMVPALRNADDLSLGGLSDQLGRLAAACRSGSIDPDLLQPEAATFTVSNLGSYGVEMFTPVINLPQAGILGVNTILERPARMEDGTFGFIPYVGLSLTYDHRALDGGPATLFLAEIKKEIEQFNHELIKL